MSMFHFRTFKKDKVMNIIDAYKCAFLHHPFVKEKYIRDDISGEEILVGSAEIDGELVQVVCAFGSNEVKDWITNFTFFLKSLHFRKPEYARSGSPIKAHSGYLSGYERIREKVLSCITSTNVLVVGFSMGGGIAPLIAVDIQYNKNVEKLTCVGFSGAKIWNKAGMISYNKRVPASFAISYSNDIVFKVVPFYKNNSIRKL
jgi:hypothetical protein